MTRIRTLVAVCVLTLALPAGLAACGGGDDGEDAQQVLTDTFSNETEVSSGVIELSLDAKAESGSDLEAELSGPFQGVPDRPDKLPQLDWSGSLQAKGGGQNIDFDGGLVVGRGNAYVEYQGKTFEVGKDAFREFKASFKQSAKEGEQRQQKAGTLFKQLGVDPSTWLMNVENEGTEEIGGVETTHIHGDANVGQVLDDLLKIGERTSAGATTGFSPEELRQGVEQFEEFVTNASVDVFSGEEDDLLRGLDLSFTVELPEGVFLGTFDVAFSLRMSELNEKQEIEEPKKAKPFSKLEEKFGVGLLGGT